ncbi:DNA recombination protein RmuC-like protein [Actinobacillus equuli]|nr:DNA recombination protein RmuC-like protein [Actinobacillus equuli]
MERYINELKERIGAFQAKSESLEEQLQFNQNALSHKERESQSLSAQLSQTQNELTELRTSLSENKRILKRNNVILLR